MANPIDNLPAFHPGVFLRDELEALNLSARKFAEHIHVAHNAVTEIMRGERSITAQMAIRLGLALGTTEQYWLNLQDIYDLKQAHAAMAAEDLRIEIICRCLDAGRQGAGRQGRDIGSPKVLPIQGAVT
jgi:antitoxin HigA-1